jgi:hypothetical protein
MLSDLIALGEVISELVNLSDLNGEAKIFAFADVERHLCIASRPFSVYIRDGLVVDYEQHAPSAFGDVVNAITKVCSQPNSSQTMIGGRLCPCS